jgi:hypothetical protein
MIMSYIALVCRTDMIPTIEMPSLLVCRQWRAAVRHMTSIHIIITTTSPSLPSSSLRPWTNTDDTNDMKMSVPATIPAYMIDHNHNYNKEYRPVQSHE